MGIERIKLRAAVTRYLTEDPTYLAYAPSTKRGYRRTLDMLVRCVPSQAQVYDLRAEHFDVTLKSLKEGASPEENAARKRLGWSPRSNRGDAALSNDFKAFRAFIKFCWRREYLSFAKNPVSHLKANSYEGRTKEAVETMVVQPSAEVFAKILDAAGQRHPRDRMVVALGAFTGLRESELKGLRISGIDFDRTETEKGVQVAAPEIRVWRKKQKAWHRVPMSAPMQREARQYLAWYEETHGTLNPEWYVIASRRSGLEGLTRDGGFWPGSGRLTWDTPLAPTMSPSTVAPDIKKAFATAGYPDLYRAGAHTLRRMAAIYIDTVTGDKDAAQTLLGHATRQSTERYLQWDDRKARLRQAMAVLNDDADALVAAPPGIHLEVHPDEGAKVLQFRGRRAVA